MRRFVLLYTLLAAVAVTLFSLAPAHAADGGPDSRQGTSTRSTG